MAGVVFRFSMGALACHCAAILLAAWGAVFNRLCALRVVLFQFSTSFRTKKATMPRLRPTTSSFFLGGWCAKNRWNLVSVFSVVSRSVSTFMFLCLLRAMSAVNSSSCLTASVVALPGTAPSSCCSESSHCSTWPRALAMSPARFRNAPRSVGSIPSSSFSLDGRQVMCWSACESCSRLSKSWSVSSADCRCLRRLQPSAPL
mmetsp:Transcript_74327/g.147194  ORF Transcript_74327/g.147194 Transcript_74327/m.147194 type:complete len:202 (+) Transcript_74327:301-906(+)